ncbi:MAG TPA: hypothetical protein EYG82_06235, partial [Sulfurovum sp.]|nr:hypothetical protein [Sulfurovum sp.]
MKKQLLARIILLAILSVNVSFASANQKTQNYASLNTMELQKMVEKLSLSGEVPFEMGIEL